MVAEGLVSGWRVKVVVLGGFIALLPSMALGFSSEWLSLHVVVIHLIYCLCSLMGGYWSSEFSVPSSSSVSNCSISDEGKLFTKSTSLVHSAAASTSKSLKNVVPNTDSAPLPEAVNTTMAGNGIKINGDSSSKLSNNYDCTLSKGKNGTQAAGNGFVSSKAAVVEAHSDPVKYAVPKSSSSGLSVSADRRSSGSLSLAGRQSSFGWIRVQVLSQLMALLFMAAFCFSLAVQAVQRLAAPDEVPSPGPQLAPLVACGLALSVHLGAVVLVGGFSRLQAALLWPDAAKRVGSRWRYRCCLWVGRDVYLGLLVLSLLLCAHYGVRLGGLDDWPQRYADPALVLLVISLLLWSNASVAATSCRLLLQAQPAVYYLSARRLVSELLAGEHVLGVHELHVWQLTPACTVFTAHVVLHPQLLQPQLGDSAVNKQLHELTLKLQKLGVSQIALQPEFGEVTGTNGGNTRCNDRCLLDCSMKQCKEARCCLPSVNTIDDSFLSVIDADGDPGADCVQQPSPDCRCLDDGQFVSVDLSSPRASLASTSDVQLSNFSGACESNSGTSQKNLTSFINRAFEP